MEKHKQQIIEAALERAADQLGDITPLVMARFLARCPDAEASFVEHWPHNPQRLQAEMVDNALYCVMTWFERRSEIEIIIYTSVPHHAETLHIPAIWYRELLAATVEVLAQTCPPDAVEEAAMWEELDGALTALVDAA